MSNKLGEVTHMETGVLLGG